MQANIRKIELIINSVHGKPGDGVNAKEKICTSSGLVPGLIWLGGSVM
jgi:hypothetical protein